MGESQFVLLPKPGLGEPSMPHSCRSTTTSCPPTAKQLLFRCQHNARKACETTQVALSVPGELDGSVPKTSSISKRKLKIALAPLPWETKRPPVLPPGNRLDEYIKLSSCASEPVSATKRNVNKANNSRQKEADASHLTGGTRASTTLSSTLSLRTYRKQPTRQKPGPIVQSAPARILNKAVALKRLQRRGCNNPSAAKLPVRPHPFVS